MDPEEHEFPFCKNLTREMRWSSGSLDKPSLQEALQNAASIQREMDETLLMPPKRRMEDEEDVLEDCEAISSSLPERIGRTRSDFMDWRWQADHMQHYSSDSADSPMSSPKRR